MTKRWRIISNVYDYFEKISVGGEWMESKGNIRFTYKCRHCSVKLTIIGCNTSNLNKHQSRCCGRFNAWANQAPGSIDPNLGAHLAAEEQEEILKELVKALVAIQVSFSIFETPRLQNVLKRLAPNFQWPCRRTLATLASQLYYEGKEKLINEVKALPLDTLIWHWFLLRQVALCLTLKCFFKYISKKLTHFVQTMNGPHTGITLAWTVWESLGERGMLKQLYSLTGDNAANNMAMMTQLQNKFAGINFTWHKDDQYHRCACHILNLVAKDFLNFMGELSDEDYEFFNEYLAINKAPIEDSNNEITPTSKDLKASIKQVQKRSGDVAKKGRARALNQATLETQDKLGVLQLLNNQLIMGSQNQDRMELGPVIRPPGSAKQREIFIQARNKTRDPQLLPISIPMTRWNYFLKQIQRARQLKLLIQIYTSLPQTMKYQLSDKSWCAMEYMEPILSMFEKTCNIFQSNAPTKHLVLPYYQVILNSLKHYGNVSPHTWRQACEAAYSKLNKYYEIELQNDDSLIAAFLNPKYCK
ncbi:hypothetical protein O181_068539 [Austropuccinia psidii MF-1]|uniref:BED-type domain-containing protein n=1 Tax=Austropuccinia psidii MF-1 TaxID=1389203 RepID=A0A9Q3EX23_9BASI|nr:hypothetical protein [Austropuccinia psidii MF-1]